MLALELLSNHLSKKKRLNLDRILAPRPNTEFEGRWKEVNGLILPIRFDSSSFQQLILFSQNANLVGQRVNCHFTSRSFIRQPQWRAAHPPQEYARPALGLLQPQTLNKQQFLIRTNAHFPLDVPSFKNNNIRNWSCYR